MPSLLPSPILPPVYFSPTYPACLPACHPLVLSPSPCAVSAALGVDLPRYGDRGSGGAPLASSMPGTSAFWGASPPSPPPLPPPAPPPPPPPRPPPSPSAIYTCTHIQPHGGATCAYTYASVYNARVYIRVLCATYTYMARVCARCIRMDVDLAESGTYVERHILADPSRAHPRWSAFRACARVRVFLDMSPLWRGTYIPVYVCIQHRYTGWYMRECIYGSAGIGT